MDTDLGRFAMSFWWLIFPLMGFAFGAFGMWMGYRTHRDRMDVMKTYAAQGKNPEEIAKLLGGPAVPPGADPYWNGYGYGRHYWGGPWAWGPWGRYGPYREWRRFIIFLCLAIGFGVASQFSNFDGSRYTDYGTQHAFTIVAIIMSVLAAGSFLFAILSTVFAASARKNEEK
jgi:hypothetical protein